MIDQDLLAALRAVVERDPRASLLWLLYADLLASANRRPEAIAALRTAQIDAGVAARAKRRLVPLLREEGQLAEALILAEDLLEKNPDDAALRAEHARVVAARGGDDEEAPPSESSPTTSWTESEPVREDARGGDRRPEAAAVNESLDPEDWASQFDWSGIVTTFADVAGLEEVKRQIRLKIIAPFQNPDIYRSFGRTGGGGILLYGPPGCGKTFIARAVAGECKARFVTVGIHEIVDKYWGESEKLLHALFQEARRQTPTVLFFDEFDALGGARGRVESHFWKTLVDQLLQEMDGVSGRNDGVLLFAATNMPWNVDSAFRRPGRFDRVLFVPPPDEPARESILRSALARVPGKEKLDVKKVLKATNMFTGADMRALAERASERALEASLLGGKLEPVTTADLQNALRTMRSSAEEWLASARNHVRYANESGQYDELAEYLRAHKRL